MKLDSYLSKNNIKAKDFAERIGLKSKASISRYISGERIPTPDVMARITKETDGQVTANDFYPAETVQVCEAPA